MTDGGGMVALRTAETEADGEAGGIISWFAAGQQIEVRTRAVFEDEPCFLLAELIRPSRSFKSRSRFQVLWVVRGDQLVTAWVYLGPAAKFAQDQFQVPGGDMFEGRGRVWHTVAELREVADELRSRKPHRELEPWDIATAFQDNVEEKKRWRKRQSTFGAGVALQRD